MNTQNRPKISDAAPGRLTCLGWSRGFAKKVRGCHRGFHWHHDSASRSPGSSKHGEGGSKDGNARDWSGGDELASCRGVQNHDKNVQKPENVKCRGDQPEFSATEGVASREQTTIPP